MAWGSYCSSVPCRIEAGSSCYVTAALQGHSYGAVGDEAKGDDAAKPMAGREEVNSYEELVGGWCGILPAPHLRETPADSNLLVGLSLAARKAALCSCWRGATAHMLQTFLVKQLLTPSPAVCMA